MRPEEFFARLEKIERTLQAVKASPGDPTKWAALIAIAYTELDWAVRLMRHCSANILDDGEDDTDAHAPTRALTRHREPKPRVGTLGAKIMDRLDRIERRQIATDERIAEVEELSGTWALPLDE